MNKGNNIPEVRFKGFDGSWKENTLNKYLTVDCKKNIEGKFSRDDVFSVSREFGVINQIEYQGRSFAGASLANYKITEKGTVIYTKSPLKDQPYGIIKANKDTSGIVSILYGVYKTNDNADSDFIQEYFNLDGRLNSYLRPIVNKGAKNTLLISDENALSGNVIFPSVKEQQSIANYFSYLDTLISTHKEKLDSLKNLKQACLVKMFPQNGKKVPEVRFKGFEGEWKEKELKQILNKYIDPVNTPHEGYIRLGIRSFAKGTFHSIVKEGEELTTAQMHRVAANKFIVNITFAWEHAVAVTTEDDRGKLVSHRFPQFSIDENVAPRFFHYIIKDYHFRHHLMLASPGGAGRNRVLKIDKMMEYVILYPTREEQQKIASYFTELDTLISTKEQEIEKLQNFKKACLEKMFC